MQKIPDNDSSLPPAWNKSETNEIKISLSKSKNPNIKDIGEKTIKQEVKLENKTISGMKEKQSKSPSISANNSSEFSDSHSANADINGSKSEKDPSSSETKIAIRSREERIGKIMEELKQLEGHSKTLKNPLDNRYADKLKSDVRKLGEEIDILKHELKPNDLASTNQLAKLRIQQKHLIVDYKAAHIKLEIEQTKHESLKNKYSSKQGEYLFNILPLEKAQNEVISIKNQLEVLEKKILELDQA